MLKKALLNRFWFPAVIAITLVALVPRAMASIKRYAYQGRTVGFSNWQTAEGAPDGSPRFRWTNARAAWREQVDGSVLIVPIYLPKPDANVEIRINGVLIERPKFESTGWSALTYDVVNLLGQDTWKSKPMLTLEFVVRKAEGDPGIGVGQLLWKGPRPD